MNGSATPKWQAPWWYRCLGHLIVPFAMAYWWWRGRRQAAYREGWRERLGYWPESDAGANNDAPLIALHAVSLGETRAALPLVQLLAQSLPEAQFLLTHATPTGREAAEQVYRPWLGARLQLSYLPLDRRGAMSRFFKHFRPCLILLMETEVWPQLVAGAARTQVPVVLVNGRLSERSCARMLRWAPQLVSQAMGHLTGIAAQTAADVARYQRVLAVIPSSLGSNAVHPAMTVTGNLKFDLQPDPCLLARGRARRADWPHTHVVMSASTREGEEAAMLSAYLPWLKPATSAQEQPRLLWLLVPRHPQRFDDVARLLQAHGVRFARFSQGDAVTAQTQVVLGDTLGEMAAWYAASDLVVMGGSWLPLGGQNLIEACACGKPVILGPHTFNFAQASHDAVAAAAACQLQVDESKTENSDASADQLQALMADLGVVLAELLADEPRRLAMAQAALAFASAHQGAAQRHLDWLKQLGVLPGLPTDSSNDA